MNNDNENLNSTENDSKECNNKFNSSSDKEGLNNESSTSNQDHLNIDIDKIIKDLQYYEKLRNAIIEMQQSNNANNSNLNNDSSKNPSNNNAKCDCDDLETIMNKTNDTLLLIDSIKTEICRLPLNPCQREYFNLYVTPLLTTLDLLARTSYGLGTSSALIADSKTLCANVLELQQNLNLVYCLNRKCAEVYCALEKNIDVLICKNMSTN